MTRTQVRDLMDRHGIRPKRSLGQNFVVEPNTVRRIAELAGVGPGDRVVEIGPGLGCLTLALAEAGAEVLAVELDDVLAGVVAEVATEAGYGGRVEVVHADATTVDWPTMLADRADGASWTLVANLPYNVSVPLVCDVLDTAPSVSRMVVMVQKEVAERLVAGPGDDAYGLPSVKVAYHGTGRMVGRVPPSVFVPRPNVDSALVEVVRRDAPAVDADPERLFALVRFGFGQRRKMLRRSLAGVLDEGAITAAGVDPTVRAEQLGLDQWAALADAGEDDR
ncbi:MAG: 16S rRNA (adenine(1518)-N(6)/adenine(1519)-N(6))-dimethyltransferase [Acidimicrobiaceae bacterium]|nr:16S rRNA (adenine(1518)-N(6)/adenine(1519)-N(6))-dimethyltransferase [Acidimicrobiaceae bacterium]